MARKFNYVSIDRIISKLYRDLGLEDIPESDVIEQAGEALEFIGAVGALEEAVAFIEVKNHRAELPIGLINIRQIARDNEWTPSGEENLCPAHIITDTAPAEINSVEEVYDEEGECLNCEEMQNRDFVLLDCEGKFMENDFNVAYYRPFYDLHYWYVDWTNSKLYKSRFTPVRLSNHTFFNSLVCEEDVEMYKSCKDEYNISNGTVITSFKEGLIAISYYRNMTDPETGYPMIPDDISYVTAITMYITMKQMARMWYSGREGYQDKMMKAEQDWQWYCKQAQNKGFLPHGIDELQNLTNMMKHMIPRNNNYYGFFGNLSNAEDRKFINPGRRARSY